ncbi:MAG: M3 family metallopeptidase [Thermoleophilia bacterium]|nr:M3 family metallopeptidase [Thermoleophilia bacterium]
MTAEPSSAAGVRWDLSRAFADTAAARTALGRARTLAAELAGQAPAAAELEPAVLRELLDRVSELVELRDALDPEFGYPGLRLLADLSDGEARDLIAECEAGLEPVHEALRTVQRSVGARPELARSTELGPYRYWAEHQAARASERLGAEAETAYAARTPTASSAWGRLSQEILTAASVEFDAGEGPRPHGVVELRLLGHHESRDVRRSAQEALRGVYREHAAVSAACLDAVIADRVAEDRLRGRADPMAATLAVDGVDRATVERVLTAAEERAGILAGWYERKRRALGADVIEPYDRFGPAGVDGPAVTWERAAAAASEAFDELSTGLGGLVREVIVARGVDAERRPRKDGGIFCASLPEGYGTYVFLSYLDSAKGATDLAHELGHAAHDEVAKRALPWLVLVEPASAAFFEVPSTLGEIVVAEHLADTIGGEPGKALLRSALEGLMSLLYEAAVLTRFEQDACARRASGQVLTPERLEELWWARDVAVNGRLAEPLGLMSWSHPYQARFYGYQYTYAILAALCLARSRREQPDGFGVAYRAMLEATGTGPPAELLARCGLDVTRPSLWHDGFDELERLCDLAW